MTQKAKTSTLGAPTVHRLLEIARDSNPDCQELCSLVSSCGELAALVHNLAGQSSGRSGDTVESAISELGIPACLLACVSFAFQEASAGRSGDFDSGLLSAMQEVLLRLSAEADRSAAEAKRAVADLERINLLSTIDGQIDALTQLPNRALFENTVQLMATSELSSKPAAAVMIDIDHFKVFNDTYGHAAGDVVLEKVACTIAEAVRSTDVPARYGGEEFCVLLPNATIEAAETVSERMRTAVEEMVLSLGDERAHVTISVGAAHACRAGKAEDIMNLLKRADRQLYMAKEAGRNQIKIVVEKHGQENYVETDREYTGVLSRILDWVREEGLVGDEQRLRLKMLPILVAEGIMLTDLCRGVTCSEGGLAVIRSIASDIVGENCPH